MTWVKLDDRVHSHPKVQAAWHEHRPSLGLHMLALSYAGAHLTDGHVPEVFVRTQLPGASERRRAVAALVTAGLWEPVPGGWRIHDFLIDNPPREEVLSRREELTRARAAGGRKGAARRWSGPSSTTNGKQAVAPGNPPCLPYGEQMANDRITAHGKRMPPTRPTPDLFPSS